MENWLAISFHRDSDKGRRRSTRVGWALPFFDPHSSKFLPPPREIVNGTKYATTRRPFRPKATICPREGKSSRPGPPLGRERPR